jgi:hypothetical protein
MRGLYTISILLRKFDERTLRILLRKFDERPIYDQYFTQEV